MSMQKRKFTREQKLQIIDEASLQGVQATLDNHGLYPIEDSTDAFSKLVYRTNSEQDSGHESPMNGK
jgi:hypothetical protein